MTQSPSFLRDAAWLEKLLARLGKARVALFGDLCLDAYWLLDAASDERSIETGLPVGKVTAQRYSPGGAGNVAANLAALGVGCVELLGLVGADLFGDELLRRLGALGLPTDGVLRGPEGWQTLVYAKPHRGTEELSRLDFGGYNPFAAEVWPALLARIEAAASRCPVVIINQQVATGWAAEVVPELNALIGRHPGTLFIVDSRHHAHRFAGAALKLNAREAARLVGEAPADDPAQASRHAQALARRQGRPVFVTRGDEGLVLAVDGELYDVPGIELPGRVDPVGAGDTALAALAAAFAVGASPLEAGMLANLAAAITTRQVGTTGVATPAQLRAVGCDPDYVHSPRLAADPSRARFLDGSRIERVSGRRPGARIRHALFDHDGTLSTLRHGWEAIMEAVMVEAILGGGAPSVDAAGRARVVETVRAFIDRTAGVQTLAQMKGLAGMVGQFGYVARSDILDEHGYKAVFNERMLAVVRERLERLGRGEGAREDWHVAGARPLLERLHGLGVRLHLFSGTDQADVEAEARALGYAHLLDGGIHGAVGDLRIEAKRQVFERILREEGLGGADLVVFGDGPVEMREGLRHGAFTVGVASNEAERRGVDPRKRTRLIRAGADLIMADYAEPEALLRHLGLG